MSRLDSLLPSFLQEVRKCDRLFQRLWFLQRGKELESSAQLPKDPLLSTERLLHVTLKERGGKGKASPSGARQKQKEKKKKNVQGSYNNKQFALYTCAGTRSKLPCERVSQLHIQAFSSPKCCRKFHIGQIAKWLALRTYTRTPYAPPPP